MIMRLVFATAVAIAAGSFSAAAQDIGVPVCDNFLKTYETCIASKAPAAQQGQMRTALEGVKANWRDVAKTADGKKSLEPVCKQTADTLKQQLAALNCNW